MNTKNSSLLGVNNLKRYFKTFPSFEKFKTTKLLKSLIIDSRLENPTAKADEG